MTLGKSTSDRKVLTVKVDIIRRLVKMFQNKMKCRLLRADVFRVDEENVVDSRNKRGYYITIKAREP